MYRLRKWYFDLLTPGGTYVFFYYASVRLAGLKARSLVLHIAPRDSVDVYTFPLKVESAGDEAADGREFEAALRDGSIRLDSGGCRIAAANSRSSVDLRFTPVVPGGTRPVLIPGRGRILWKPIGIRYRVDGCVTLDGSRLDVAGSAGYADFLESTILPPLVPVRRLLWGRAHHPEGDCTFMHASGAEGTPSWSRLILHRGGKVSESEEVEISRPAGGEQTPAPGTGGVTVRAGLPGEEFRMTIRREKLVQSSSFIDQQEIRWPFARSLAKRITRNPRGSKFLSRFEVPGWKRGEQGSFMIDEEAFL